MQLRAEGNFVSAYRIQVDRIELWWNWIESRSNIAPSGNAPYLYYFIIYAGAGIYICVNRGAI